MSSFGVYVHYPFCRSKCPYCDFPSVAYPSPPQSEYADAVIQELEARWNAFAGYTLGSVYFGGGTPSLWAPRELTRVLSAILGRFPRHASYLEITVEMNPADVTRDLLRAYLDGGVNRFSLGVQSFDPASLAILGRRHDRAGALRALELLRGSAAAYSFDIMVGLPGPGDSLGDIEEALAWEAGHLSVYELSLEPGTPMARAVERGDLTLPGQAEVLETLSRARELLRAVGLERYEISNFARPGAEARHNLSYWRCQAYLGLGAAAHSHLPGPTRSRRWANVASPRAYMEAPLAATAMSEDLGPEDMADERLMCQLRLAEGLDLGEHVRLGGSDLRVTQSELIAELLATGLATLDDGVLRLTDQGMDLSDEIIARLVSG